MTITGKGFQENCIRKLTGPGTGVLFTSNDDVLKQLDALRAEFQKQFPRGTITGQDVRASFTPITFPSSLWRSSLGTPPVTDAVTSFSRRCFLVTEYTTWFSIRPLFPYRVVFTITLKPGQAIRCLVRNLSRSKDLASTRLTLPEEVSEGTLAAFQQAIDVEVTQRGDPSTSSVENLSMMARPRPIHVGTEISCGTGSIAPDLASQFKMERYTSDAILTAALRRHVQERVAIRQLEIMVPVDIPAQSDPGSRVEEITNPSEIAPMTTFFIQPAQELVAIRAVTDIRLLFCDGTSHREYQLGDFDAAMQDQLVMHHPGTPVAVDDFHRVIQQAMVIKDYRERTIQMLEDAGTTGFHLARRSYSALLENEFDEQDAAILPIQHQIHGAVSSITPFTVPVQAYLLRTEMGAPCVDDATLRQIEATTQTRG